MRVRVVRRVRGVEVGMKSGGGTGGTVKAAIAVPMGKREGSVSIGARGAKGGAGG